MNSIERIFRSPSLSLFDKESLIELKREVKKGDFFRLHHLIEHFAFDIPHPFLKTDPEIASFLSEYMKGIYVYLSRRKTHSFMGGI